MRFTSPLLFGLALCAPGCALAEHDPASPPPHPEDPAATSTPQGGPTPDASSGDASSAESCIVAQAYFMPGLFNDLTSVLSNGVGTHHFDGFDVLVGYG